MKFCRPEKTEPATTLPMSTFQNEKRNRPVSSAMSSPLRWTTSPPMEASLRTSAGRKARKIMRARPGSRPVSSAFAMGTSRMGLRNGRSFSRLSRVERALTAAIGIMKKRQVQTRAVVASVPKNQRARGDSRPMLGQYTSVELGARFALQPAGTFLAASAASAGEAKVANAAGR